MVEVHHPEDLPPVANLDLERAERRGYGEAILCEPKSVAQVAQIALQIADSGVPTLFTRANPDHAQAIKSALPDAFHDADAGLLAWPPTPPDPVCGLVAVLSAGTSDLPFARDAQLTARYLGRRTELVVDVGVAGIHRLFAHEDLLHSARVIVVAAGMDGALPSVVAGL